MARPVITEWEGVLFRRQLNAVLDWMENKLLTDPNLEIARGNVDGQTLVHKFGHNAAVGTTYVPIANGGIYPTPTPSNATTLRIKAGGDANDTAAGTGAREITLQGLDETGAFAEEALATAGASASSATTTTFMRLFRFLVSDSGTYADSANGSHADDIVIENGAGGTDWGTIDSTDFPKGQSEVAVYSVPNGSTAYLTFIDIEVETTKSVDALLFVRSDLLDETAGYPAIRLQQRFTGITDHVSKMFEYPIAYTGPCDIGIMAKTSVGTAAVNAQFELVLVEGS